MATGSGRTLGAALAAALKAGGWHGARVAKGWRAQLSALTRTAKGQAALVDAGVSPGRRAENWRAWLSEQRDAQPKTRQTIQDVYLKYILPDSATGSEGKISGPISTEQGRTRNRGVTEAPLRVDHRGADWSRIKHLWLQGADEADIEDAYIQDVIFEDMDFSYFDLPGSNYTVSIG